MIGRNSNYFFFCFFFFCSPFESRALFLLGRWSGVLSNILRWLVDERQLVDGASIPFFSWTSLRVESEPVNLRIRMKKLLCFLIGPTDLATILPRTV